MPAPSTAVEVRDRLLDGDPSVTLADLEAAERADRDAALSAEAAERKAGRDAEAERLAQLVALHDEIVSHPSDVARLTGLAEDARAALDALVSAMTERDRFVAAAARRMAALGAPATTDHVAAGAVGFRSGSSPMVAAGARRMASAPIADVVARMVVDLHRDHDLPRSHVRYPSDCPPVAAQLAGLEARR